MKDAQDALVRVIIYIAVAASLSAISGTVSLSHVTFLWALLAAPGETAIIIRNTIHNRRLRLAAIENAPTKELPIPDTQPLDKH